MLGSDNAVEQTCGVGFAGLVVKHKDNSPPHVKPLVVIASLVRSDDPKASECELAMRHAAGAEAMWVKVSALKEFTGRRAAGRFETTGRIGPRRDQIVAQEERSVVRNRSESQARKPGGDELGGKAILGGRGEAPAKGISREKDQVCLQMVPADRIVLGRMAVGAAARMPNARARCGEMLTAWSPSAIRGRDEYDGACRSLNTKTL